jgi:hypothetical protein
MDDIFHLGLKESVLEAEGWPNLTVIRSSSALETSQSFSLFHSHSLHTIFCVCPRLFPQSATSLHTSSLLLYRSHIIICQNQNHIIMQMVIILFEWTTIYRLWSYLSATPHIHMQVMGMSHSRNFSNNDLIKNGAVWRIITLTVLGSGLRGLEVTFPPHDPSDAGSNPAEIVEFLRTEKFREQSPSEGTLSRLTRVVDLLHVKETQAPEGDHWAKFTHISRPSRASNSSGRWWCAFYSLP